MAKMKAVQVPKAGADFEIVEREVPQPDAGHVRIRVQACGICHSDVITKEGLLPGITYPCVPGHEVASHDLIRQASLPREAKLHRVRSLRIHVL